MYVVPCQPKPSPISSAAVGGAAESIVTSVGGAAITLAGSGAGVVTSLAGSEFTVIAGPTR